MEENCDEREENRREEEKWIINKLCNFIAGRSSFRKQRRAQSSFCNGHKWERWEKRTLLCVSQRQCQRCSTLKTVLHTEPNTELQLLNRQRCNAQWKTFSFFACCSSACVCLFAFFEVSLDCSFSLGLLVHLLNSMCACMHALLCFTLLGLASFDLVRLGLAWLCANEIFGKTNGWPKMHQQLNCTNNSKWRHCTRCFPVCSISYFVQKCSPFCLLFFSLFIPSFSYAVSMDIPYPNPLQWWINMYKGTCTMYAKRTIITVIWWFRPCCTTVYLLFSACRVISNMCSFITNWVKKKKPFCTVVAILFKSYANWPLFPLVLLLLSPSPSSCEFKQKGYQL